MRNAPSRYTGAEARELRVELEKITEHLVNTSSAKWLIGDRRMATTAKLYPN